MATAWRRWSSGPWPRRPCGRPTRSSPASPRRRRWPPVDHWDDATAGADPGPSGPPSSAAFVDAAGGGLEAAGYCATGPPPRCSCRRPGSERRAGHGRSARRHPPRPPTGTAEASRRRLRPGDVGAPGGSRRRRPAEPGPRPRPGPASTPLELPPGNYEVVLEPRAVASALVYPAYMGFNGKAHAEGTSFVHLGERQWDAVVDIWDDATDPRALGVGFDAEGTPKRRLDLVQGGVSVGPDARPPLGAPRRRRADGPLGRLRGVRRLCHQPVPRRRVTSRRIGWSRQVERGLLVTDLWYNRILDPKTQVVTGLTRNGLFLVEEGEMVGRGPEPALHAVDRGRLRPGEGCWPSATTPSWWAARAASCTSPRRGWRRGPSPATPGGDRPALRKCRTPSLVSDT